MGNLHVALQDGFDDDTVEVRVDGLLVFQREAVTTMTQISLAASFDVEVAGPVELEVSLPGRDLSTLVSVPEQPGGAFVAVSVVGDSLVHRLAEEPFGYA